MGGQRGARWASSRDALCQSVRVRVATLNLLHGVPLRDHGPEPTLTGAVTGHGETKLQGSVGRRTASPSPAEPEDLDAGLAVSGVEATARSVWSPSVEDPADLLRAVEELLADGPIDVLALQEVDRYQDRSGGVDQARLVAEAMKAEHWRFVPSVRGTPGIATEGAAWVPATEADDLPGDDPEPATPRSKAARAPRYGIALISRYPVRQWRVRRFPPAPVSLPLKAPAADGRSASVRVPDEPRSAVSAIIELPGVDMTVATAHLSFVPGTNARQLRELRAFLGGQPRPLILMGDFNLPGGIPRLSTGWQQVVRTPTYPVGRPRIQFDHVLADGWTRDALEQARGTARAVPLAVSDHCAVVVDFPDP